MLDKKGCWYWKIISVSFPGLYFSPFLSIIVSCLLLCFCVLNYLIYIKILADFEVVLSMEYFCTFIFKNTNILIRCKFFC